MVAGRFRTRMPSIATDILPNPRLLHVRLCSGVDVNAASAGYRCRVTRGDKRSVRCCVRPGSIPNPAMKLTGRAFCTCKPQAPAARPATYRHRSASTSVRYGSCRGILFLRPWPVGVAARGFLLPRYVRDQRLPLDCYLWFWALGARYGDYWAILLAALGAAKRILRRRWTSYRACLA